MVEASFRAREVSDEDKTRSLDRLTRIEAKLDLLLHQEPVEGKGTLGGKRVVHVARLGTGNVIYSTCGEHGTVFTLLREFANCKKCLKKLEDA